MRSVLRAPTRREMVGGCILGRGWGGGDARTCCPVGGGGRDMRSRGRAGNSDQPRPVCGSCRLTRGGGSKSCVRGGIRNLNFQFIQQRVVNFLSEFRALCVVRQVHRRREQPLPTCTLPDAQRTDTPSRPRPNRDNLP